jgi:hypothetical protein
MEATPPFTRGPSLVGSPSPGEGLVLGQGHDGIELRVKLLNALERALGQFDG